MIERKASIYHFLCLLPLLILGLAECNNHQSSPEETTAPAGGQLIIFSAASLTEAFTEMAQAFKLDHPGVEVVLNFAGSQQLAQQLAQGAPADIFASANERQMEAAVAAGRVDDGNQQIFATNRLIIIFPGDNPANLQTIGDLAEADLRLVLAAPEVPVGQYSQEFLEKTASEPDYGPDFAAAVQENIVSYEENVRAVLSKVVLGEADAGIVYKSDLNAETAASIGQIPIPDSLNTLAVYPIAPINNSSQPELAAAFLNFVLSSTGQEILTEYGFSPPK